MKKKKIFLIISLLCMSKSVMAFSDVYAGNLPRDLYELAQQADCAPVPNFFNQAGTMNPPYLYGYLPGREEDSAVFWCHKKRTNKDVLMFMYKGKLTTPAGCQPYLDLSQISNVPGGLSLSKENHVDLSFFRYHEYPHRRGSVGKVTEYSPFFAGNEAGHLIYCYKGKWMTQMLD